jgi:hypothetical protein
MPIDPAYASYDYVFPAPRECLGISRQEPAGNPSLPNPLKTADPGTSRSRSASHIRLDYFRVAEPCTRTMHSDRQPLAMRFMSNRQKPAHAFRACIATFSLKGTGARRAHRIRAHSKSAPVTPKPAGTCRLWALQVNLVPDGKHFATTGGLGKTWPPCGHQSTRRRLFFQVKSFRRFSPSKIALGVLAC